MYELCLTTCSQISKENIKWFIPEDKPKWISEMSTDSISDFVKQFIRLRIKTQKLLDESHRLFDTLIQKYFE